MLRAEEVPEGFSARHDATSRTYLYRVLARRQPSPFERGRALWWPHSVDEDALHACARALPGTHDFTAFTPTETYHTRFTRDVHRAEWVAQRRHPRVPDRGRLVHAQHEPHPRRHDARGRRGRRDDFATLLEGAPRSAAGNTAPAHGLYLAAVRYA